MKIEHIQSVVEDYFNLQPGAILIKTRKREIVQARQIAMYFSKKLTDLSLAYIGSKFAGRDHTTVMHSVKTVNNLMKYDKYFNEDVQNIVKKLDLKITEKEKTDAIIKGLCYLLKMKLT